MTKKPMELPLPRLSAFTNGWVATEKAAQYPSSNLPVAITTSLDPLAFYEKYQISFLNKNIEIQPQRFNLSRENVAAVAAMMPSSAALDVNAICFDVLTKYGLHIYFITAQVDSTGEWRQCYYNDESCTGYLCVCNDDDLMEVLQMAKEVWPFKGRHADKAKYPAGIKLACYPFDSNGKVNAKVRQRFSVVEDGVSKPGERIYRNMAAEYLHSRTPPEDGGGRVTSKFIRDMASLTTPLMHIDGETTDLRAFITSITDDVTGKPFFSAIKPAPTKGNKKSILTVLTTYRAGSAKRTEDIAVRGRNFLKDKLAELVWTTFGPDQAKKVMAAAICQKLEMDEVVTMDDVTGADEDFVGMQFFVDEEADLEDTSIHSAWDQSVVTTQSTRDRLSATESELEEKNLEMEEKDKELQEREQEKQINLRQIANLEKQAEAIRREKADEIAELMRQLEVAKAESHKGTHGSPDPPLNTAESPPVLLKSQRQRHTRNGTVDDSPPRRGSVATCASSEAMSVGND